MHDETPLEREREKKGERERERERGKTVRYIFWEGGLDSIHTIRQFTIIQGEPL